MSCEHEGPAGAVWHLPSAHAPTPGQVLMLPACTSAPRSLSHSKLLVPNTKLLSLAKEEKKKRIMVVVGGN